MTGGPAKSVWSCYRDKLPQGAGMGVGERGPVGGRGGRVGAVQVLSEVGGGAESGAGGDLVDGEVGLFQQPGSRVGPGGW